MKTRTKLILTPLAAAVIGSLVLYGCGSSGGGGGDAGAMVAGVPAAGANSPFIGVTMQVTCANGVTGATSLVGTDAAPGEGIISLPGACTPPLRVDTIIPPGKMRPLGAKAGGSEDVVYDPAVNLPMSTVLLAIPTGSVPVNPVTTLFANQVTLANAATNLAAAKAAVAKALGLALTDVDQDYRNAGVAASSARIVEAVALAEVNAATNGMPTNVANGTKTLGQFIAEGLANQASTAAANSLNNATGIAAALTAVDAKFGGSTAARLANIDSDAIRVNNLIAIYTASAHSEGEINALIAAGAKAAADAGAGATPAQTQALADVKAHQQQVAQDSVRDSAAKMVADVTATPGVSTAAVNIAIAAAAKIVADQITAMQQTGAVPADIAAQAKVVADSVTAAIKADTTATTKIFATVPAVSNAGAAAALVGQLENTAAVKAVTASSTTTVTPTSLGSDALKVATAISGIAAPVATGVAATDAATQAAFQAAVGAVASAVDPATVNVTDATTKTNLTTTITSLQTQLVAAITAAGSASIADGSAGALAQQAGVTQLGIATNVSFATTTTTPTSVTGALALATTTTAPATSTTSNATTTTTTAAATTTTAAATTTTAAATTTTAAATTTTAGGGTTTTAAATTTTTAAATTTTTTATTTTTLALAGCQVKLGSALGFVTGVTSSSQCVGTGTGSFNVNGGGAVVTAVTSIPAGSTTVAVGSLLACDPFGSPPTAGATTLTPCKN